jgi:hypothetical protein
MANTISWQTDMKAALDWAKAEKKNVLMDFFNPG